MATQIFKLNCSEKLTVTTHKVNLKQCSQKQTLRGNCTNVQLCNCTNVQLYKCTIVQMSKV